MGGVLLAIAYRSRPNGTARIFLFNLAVLQPRIFICTKNREMVQCSVVQKDQMVLKIRVGYRHQYFNTFADTVLYLGIVIPIEAPI